MGPTSTHQDVDFSRKKEFLGAVLHLDRANNCHRSCRNVLLLRQQRMGGGTAGTIRDYTCDTFYSTLLHPGETEEHSRYFADFPGRNAEGSGSEESASRHGINSNAWRYGR